MFVSVCIPIFPSVSLQISFPFCKEKNIFQVVDVACGYGYTVLAVKDESGPSCYGTGLNSDSQIGKLTSNTQWLE